MLSDALSSHDSDSDGKRQRKRAKRAKKAGQPNVQKQFAEDAAVAQQISTMAISSNPEGAAMQAAQEESKAAAGN